MADSGITLIVRFVNKEKWYEGHSCHAYQNARRWGSHERVVVWMLLVNLMACTIELVVFSIRRMVFIFALSHWLPIIFVEI